MSTAGPKQQVFASLAEIAQALGHAHRLELLEHLGQGERSVEELAARAGLTLANASRHLQLLRRAALVVGRREGKRVFYRLSGEDAVIDLLRALSRVGERNSAEIARVTRPRRIRSCVPTEIARSPPLRFCSGARCAARR